MFEKKIKNFLIFYAFQRENFLQFGGHNG